jgi:peptidoglycan hydrolase-like protein with peptidoglycan-binding domain
VGVRAAPFLLFMNYRLTSFVTPLIALCLLGAGFALPQTTGTKKSTPAHKGKSVKGKSSGPYRQSAPTSERYKEIQQALKDKGYLKTEPNGIWDNDSQEAMKQFQTGQKLNATGKITAPALIALGLGPRPASSDIPAATPPAQ